MDQLPDTNVWLALTLKAHVHHAVALAWYKGVKHGQAVAFCRASQQSLLRLLTTEAVMRAYNRPALSNRQAWAIQREWEDGEQVRFAEEPPGLELPWEEFACLKSPSPKLWMDAYLAAFAKAAGLHLVATDKAFTQFHLPSLTVLE